jgi:hypothetical protein
MRFSERHGPLAWQPSDAAPCSSRVAEQQGRQGMPDERHRLLQSLAGMRPRLHDMKSPRQAIVQIFEPNIPMPEGLRHKYKCTLGA